MAASGSVSSLTPIVKMLTPVAMYLTAAESTRDFCRVPRSLGKFTLMGALTRRNCRSLHGRDDKSNIGSAVYGL
jgi:hypothetical protein